MKTSIHIAEAIERGNRIIYQPMMAIGIGFPVLALAIQYFLYGPDWLILAGIISGILFGFLYKSIMTPRWKVWSFTAVDDIHALREKAIRASLIGDGNLLKPYEFRTAGQTYILREIDSRLSQSHPGHTFLDDDTVPDEVVIRYSQPKNYLQMFGSLVIAGIGLFSLFQLNVFSGLVCLAVGGLGVIRELRETNDKRDQILISNQGITTMRTGFTPWSHIQNERVESTASRSGRSSYQCLKYSFSTKESVKQFPHEEEVNIDDLDITPADLEHLLTIYRGRSERQTATT